MTKQEFLDRLQAGLLELTESDARERVTFYSEAIDDRIEEGLSEEEAVAQIGEVEEIVAAILSEIPQKAIRVAEPVTSQPKKEPQKEQKEKKEQSKGLKPWQIVMLIVGAPLWIPLMIAAFAVILALLVVLWSVAVSAWAVFGSLAGSALGMLVASVAFITSGELVGSAGLVGCGLICAGLSIFAFHGSLALTKGCAWLTKMVCKGICKLFVTRRDA